MTKSLPLKKASTYPILVKSPIGHNKQRKALAGLVREDKLPSTILLAGTRGIGKHQVALELARHLLCSSSQEAPLGGCGICRTCTLFNSNTHPDLHSLTFGEDGATVDDVRSTLESLSLRSFMGGRKVAIFNDVDNISLVGSNIILKSLEEPRPETFFLLIASTPSRLPQTLLSRCQRWFLDRLTHADIREILIRSGVDELESDALAHAADGSVASLETVRSRAEMYDSVKTSLDLAFTGDEALITKAAQEWGADKTGLRDRLTFLRTAVRERLVQSAEDADAAAIWAHVLQDTLDAEYLMLERHVNPTLCLLHLLRGCNRSRAQCYRDTPHAVPGLMKTVLG